MTFFSVSLQKGTSNDKWKQNNNQLNVHNEFAYNLYSLGPTRYKNNIEYSKQASINPSL